MCDFGETSHISHLCQSMGKMNHEKEKKRFYNLCNHP